MRRYLVGTSVISAILLLGYYLLDALHVVFLHQKIPLIIVFFFMQSFPISWMLRQGERDSSSFVMYALGSIGFRLITGLFLLLLLSFLAGDQLPALAIQFSVVYLVYLVFELLMVLATLRRN